MTGENITFTLKSNLLGEFGKIVAGSSQTIRLPRTVRNMRILDFPEVVSRSGSMVRRKLSARLEKNGVPMIDDGEAVVLSTGEDGYEVGITYGVVSFLSAVKDGGSLNELPDEGEQLLWDANSLTSTPINGQSLSYGFGNYDNGVNDTSVINVHPVVSMGWILDKISRTFGMNIVGCNVIDKYILLTEKKGHDTPTLELELYRMENLTTSGKSIVGTWIDKIEAMENVQYDAPLAYDNGKIIAVDGNTNVLSITANIPTVMGKIVCKKNTGYVIYQANTNGGILRFDLITKLSPSEYIVFEYEGSEDISNGYISIRGGISFSLSDDVTYGRTYPIVANLPNIKIEEYIKMCGILTGTFPMYRGNPNTLEMVSVERIRGGEPLDWSDKWGGEPDSIEYTFLNARQNIIQYKNDKDIEESGQARFTRGVVTVNDSSLVKSSTLYEIPLSGSKRNKIHQYRIGEDGEVEDSDVSERILTLDAMTNVVSYSEELYPQNIIDTALVGYRDLVRKPIVIKGTFRLTELDIWGLDYMRPVYLRQMGRYYGIVQVQYKGDESVVELLQLP